MQKKHLYKFIFLVIIAILAIVFYLYNTFGSNDEEDVEDMFRSESEEKAGDDEESNDFQLEDYDLDFDEENGDEKSSSNTNDGESNEETTDTNEDEEVVEEDDVDDYETLDEFDYESNYIDQFGEANYERSLTRAEKVLRFYLTEDMGDNPEFKKIEKEVTDGFLKKLKNRDNQITKRIDSLEIFPAEPVNDDELIIGGIVEYGGNSEFFHVVFTTEDDVFLVDKIVSMWGI